MRTLVLCSRQPSIARSGGNSRPRSFDPHAGPTGHLPPPRRSTVWIPLPHGHAHAGCHDQKHGQ
eukprot:90318-Chlamydomonas_euryale.AAC.4